MKAVQQKSTLARYLRLLDIGVFLRWWLDGLAACVPATMRSWFSVSATRMVLDVLDDEMMLLHREGDEPEELGRYHLQTLAAGDLRGQLNKTKNKRSILRLPTDKVLTKDMTLPSAAEANLRQIVGFEMDRLTPFTPDKLYYDVYVLDRRLASRRIQVRFIAVLRSVVDDLLVRLAAVGVSPDVIDVVGEPEVNFLPPEKRPRKSRAAQRVQWALAVFCLLLLAGACAVPLWQQRNLAMQLMPKVNNAQRQAEVVFALREELERSIESSRFLIEKRRKSVLTIELLDELTAILPDGTWVEQLIVKDDEVQIRGQSLEASMLIGLVEASDLFRNASFRSPVIADRRTGRDRFYLAAQIAKES